MKKDHILEPIKNIVFVDKHGSRLLDSSEILIDKVGAKAFGLSLIPEKWTVPFFVVSTDLFKDYCENQNINNIKATWFEKIVCAAKLANVDLSIELFLRSNVCSEHMSSRGSLKSYECVLESLFSVIKEYFDELLNANSISTQEGPLLIQQYIQDFGKGHITNERRIAKEARDWKGEIENRFYNGNTIVTTDEPFNISLRNWRREIDYSRKINEHLRCTSLHNVAQVLVYPCAWASDRTSRVHFEWIYDGTLIYIVQADQETDYGVNPIEIGMLDSKDSTLLNPQVLTKLSSNDEHKYSKYAKVQNAIIYEKLGMKTAPIFLLKCGDEFERLRQGCASSELQSDLEILAQRSLVIRVDVETDDHFIRQMLPRTCEVRSLEKALEWLYKFSKHLYDEFNNKTQYIFILHNFIPAHSSAFAYAEPKNRNVLVESLWGLPEGLYYYSHDKYAVDTKSIDLDRIELQKITYKEIIQAINNFVCPQKDGSWEVNQVHPDYIWRKAIRKIDWLKTISIQTRQIAEFVGTGVSVMWFVGVDQDEYNCSVFPWHHEVFTYNEVPKQANRRKNSYVSDFVVKTYQDIEKLQGIVDNGNVKDVKYIMIQPIEEQMIRNKDMIERIGKLAKEIDAVIILNGGVLSHAYYQLQRTGVAVEVYKAFEVFNEDTEYSKLVRDKIPEKIEKGGEVAFINELSRDELLNQLKFKMVEEAIEVLEAESEDEIVQELADILEVFDSIIDKLNLSKEVIVEMQKLKKQKVGGFDKGIILKRTVNPIYNNIKEKSLITDSISVGKKDSIEFRSDIKERRDYREYFKRIKIPILLERWETTFNAKSLINNVTDLFLTLKGTRKKNIMEIEISGKEPNDNSKKNSDSDQLSLF